MRHPSGIATGSYMLVRTIWAAILVGCASSVAYPQTPSAPWVGTWATAPVHDTSGRSFTRETLRQIVHASVAGSRVRIHISNLFGERPLLIEDVHLALRNTGSSIVPGTDHQLRFRGHISVVIPQGAEVVSDPLPFHLPALADVAVSFYLPKKAGAATYHASAHLTSYIAPGDVSGKTDLSEAKTTGSDYFLVNLDVQGKDIRGAVVTLGASITEGYQATENTSRRWSDVLAQRLANADLKIGVLNEGISGNRLLVSGAGDSAESRFERDVLNRPGVRWVIFSDDPINDLGSTKPPPTFIELIAGLERIIFKAHQKNIQFFCSTLTPYQGANYWTAEEESTRKQFNAFLHDKQSGCDAVIDQDSATHDPAHPARYLPTYDSGDHLHPNDAGHQAIGNAVNPSLFLQSDSGAMRK
jgi:lysophospholipase L1-like esterase